MAVHSAEAIVLRRYPFRETSVTLTCVTDRFGKLKGLVKGLHAQPNRYRSAMDPFTVNRIVFYETRTSPLHLITQCDLLVPFEQIPRDLNTMQLAALCVELVDTVLPLEEPQPAVYHLLKRLLERLSLGGTDLLSARIHFIARLLRCAGFQPQLVECTSCTLTIHRSGYWSARQGGLLCPGCLYEDPQAEAVLPQMLEVLALLSEAEQPLELDASLASVVSQRLDEFLRWRLDRPLRTLAA